MYACEVLNMLFTKFINYKTSIFVWSEKVPDISRLKIWSCLAYAHKNSCKLLKLEPKAIFCMYLRHFSNNNG